MNNNLNSRLPFFEYRGRSVYAPAFCTNNEFHYDLYKKGLQDGSLVTVNNRPPVVGSADLNGISMGVTSLDTWLARVQAYILAKEGIHLPSSNADKFREALVSSYFLNSCLCVVEVNTQRGIEYQLVTKNPSILLDFRSKLAPKELRKGFDRFQDQYSNRYEELCGGNFAVVRVFLDVDGIHLKKYRLSARNARHLLPYYSVNNYAAKVVRKLQKQRVELVYSLDGATPNLKTTLNTEILANWLGSTSAEAVQAVRSDWSNPLSFGYLSLPDLTRIGQFVSVPVLHLHNFKPYV